MSLQAPVSVDRLTARVAQLETSNMALSGIVATIVTIAIIVVATATISHVGQAKAGLTQCATSKAVAAQCRPARPRSAVRILSA
jgi:uncharacterized membrane protein